MLCILKRTTEASPVFTVCHKVISPVYSLCQYIFRDGILLSWTGPCEKNSLKHMFKLRTKKIKSNVMAHLSKSLPYFYAN